MKTVFAGSPIAEFSAAQLHDKSHLDELARSISDLEKDAVGTRTGRSGTGHNPYRGERK